MVAAGAVAVGFDGGVIGEDGPSGEKGGMECTLCLGLTEGTAGGSAESGSTDIHTVVARAAANGNTLFIT